MYFEKVKIGGKESGSSGGGGMYSSTYAKPYSSGSGNATTSRQPSTSTNVHPSGTLPSGRQQASGFSSSSNVVPDRDRPSTLNLSSGGIGSTSASGSGSGAGQSNLPNKPSRYVPVYPTLLSTNPAKPSSYSSLLTQPPHPLPTSSTHTSPFAPPSTSIYSSSLRQEGLGGGGGSGNQPVITLPSGKTIYESRHPQYYPPNSQLRPQGSGNLTGAGSSAISKSAHNLVDYIPDVFCLSCPPAEFKFSDAYRAKTLPRAGKENERLIGFATLPEQVHRKSVKKGFDFTLMVVGESGLGKSTLINSLFLADFYQDRKVPSVADTIKRTTTVQKHAIEIEERGVRLRLTVVDTPGFGDAINCEDSWKTCIDYIDDQFHQYFQAESGLNRKHIQDGRVHCCLYFIPSYGRGLRQLDIEALKQLQGRVNIIPVIGKADTLTPTEVRNLKDKILEDLRSNHIQTYQFPDCDEDEDEEFKRQDRELKAAIPFAVASSDTFVEIAGRRLRGRVYPWGIVEVENPSHSDFGKLRTMLIQTHMHDLKETTQDLHYENFRAKAIAKIAQNSNGHVIRDRSSTGNKLQKRDSTEITSAQETLMQKEAEIKRMQQMISKMEAKLKAAGGGQQSRGESIDC